MATVSKLPLVAPTSWPPPDAPKVAPPGYWRTMMRLWQQAQRAALHARMAAHRASLVKPKR